MPLKVSQAKRRDMVFPDSSCSTSPISPSADQRLGRDSWKEGASQVPEEADTVVVKGLPQGITSSELRDMFVACGPGFDC